MPKQYSVSLYDEELRSKPFGKFGTMDEFNKLPLAERVGYLASREYQDKYNDAKRQIDELGARFDDIMVKCGQSPPADCLPGGRGCGAATIKNHDP